MLILPFESSHFFENFYRFTVKHALQNTQMIATSGFLTALNYTKFVFGRGSAPDPVEGAYNASPELGWGGGYPLPIPNPRRLWRRNQCIPGSAFSVIRPLVQFGENGRRNATVRVSTDGHTHAQTQNEFIICPMLYAIAMGLFCSVLFLWGD